MKISKKLRAEISSFLETYWRSYIGGDLEKWSSLIADDYHNIGTTNEELWKSKKDVLDYTYNMLDQMVGQVDFRNKKIELISYEPYLMTHELGDLYVKNVDDWVFYAPIRLSSILTQTDNGWQVLHQHGSYPDSRTDQGEAFALDALKAENKKLQAAVKKRTEELLIKNKELEIEASLERVRAVAMGMTKPEDLLGICKVLHQEFIGLGFVSLRNAMVNLHDDQLKSLDNYDYSGGAIGTKTQIAYNSHPATKNIVRQLKKSNNAFGSFSLKGKKLDEWRDYRKSLGEKDDPLLKTTNVLSYYFYSIGSGSIGISTYGPLKKDDITLLERFRNVFELAYRRFTDIQKAEAQAREAQIEASLERVRARSMAMHRSNELSEVAVVLNKELRQLGYPDLFEAGYVNWDVDSNFQNGWLSDFEGKSMEPFQLPIKGDKILNERFKGWKNQTPLLYQVIGGEALISHVSFCLPTLGSEQVKQQVEQHFSDPTHFYHSFFKEGALCVITQNALTEAQEMLLVRFSNVFQQTYRRFLDLQKAEAQAREAQVEAALERVRSRSMAMQKSEELADLSLELVKQVQELGEDTWFCAFNIYDDDPKGSLEWGSNGEGTFPKYRTPREGVFLRYYNAGQRGETLLINEIGTDECPIHYEYLCTLPGVGDQLLTMKAAGIPFPSSQIDHVAYFKYGYILFITYDAVPELHEIFIRFAKVFEQSYTRFLDLKKAEAQAWEAKIEAALERVRAQSMAMHHSKELVDVVLQINTQIFELGIQIDYTQIFSDFTDDPKDGATMWMASINQDYLQKFKFPYFNDPLDKEIWGMRGSGKSLLLCRSKGQKNSYLRKAFKYSDLKLIPKERQKALLEAPGWSSCIVAMANSSFNFGRWNLNEFNKEEEEIFVRFSKVFEQTYARFLDLQKAEEQAREAQIEVALERVRARTMAMHKSEELKDVVKEIFSQMALLNINAEHAGIVVEYEPKQDWHFWVAERQDIPAKISVPYLDLVWDRQFTEAKKKGKEFFTTELNFKEKNKFYEVLLPHIKGLTRKAKNFYLRCPGLAISTAIEQEVALYIENFNGTPYTDGENEILRRFTKVFQQTYTRFLDLKKAEAQTREAQINLGVERVRASAMAMHKSDDLTNSVETVFSELKQLGFNTVRCGIGIFNDKSNYVNAWTISSNTGKGTAHLSGDERLEGHPLLDKIYESWTNQVDFSYTLKGKDLKKYYQVVSDSNLPVSGPDNNKSATQYYHLVVFPAGGLFAFSDTEFTHDKKLLMKRFGEVFHLSFTRHLDLKQAEAQAREAQIEIALEKVRSKSLAMHKSVELAEIGNEVFLQLEQLGINAEASWLWFIGQKPDEIEIWISHNNAFAKKITVHAKDYNTFSREIQAWKERVPYLKLTIPKTDAKKVIKKHFGITLKGGKNTNLYHILQAGHEYGFLGLGSWQEPSESEVNIYMRFAKVFEQAYTRFLDLQKAEQQAKEARIETALERVRARTMAMHNSDELAETVAVLFQQLAELGETPERMNIGVIKEESKSIDFWSTEQGGKQISQRFSGDIDEPTTIAKLYIAWKTKQKTLVIDLQGKELTAWIDHIQREMGIPFKENLIQKRRVHTAAFFTQGVLLVSTPDPLPTESVNLLIRFTKVFDQTYTRFLDLEKAEAQGREAQIEAALERVRSRSMAMHKSYELHEVIQVLFEQLQQLNFNIDAANFVLNFRDSEAFTLWAAVPGQLYPSKIHMPYVDTPIFNRFIEAKEQNLDFYADRFTFAEKNEFFEHFFNYVEGVTEERKHYMLSSPGYARSTVLLKNIALYILNYAGIPYSDAENSILKRFAQVFEQSYTRFLDLEKSEAQARESQIELALERIRSQATAMKVSTDLLDIVVTMRAEFIALGHDAEYFWHMRYLPEIYEKAMTSGDGTKIGMVMNLPRHIHGDIKLLDQWEKGTDPTVVYAMDIEAAIDYVHKMVSLGDFKQVDPNAPSDDDMRHIGGLTFIMARTTHGEIGYSLPGVVTDPPADDLATLVRFAGVFDLAYRRFEDLQIAEAQAKEAIKQSSLDRVRAEIASMRKTKDLERITPLLWKELGILGVPFFRCGVFIVNEEEEMVHAYLSNPSGASLAALHLAFDDADIALVQSTVTHWKRQSTYIEEWTKENFIESMRLFLKKGQIQDSNRFQSGEAPPEKLVLHLVPFKQGMLYAGSEMPLIQEHVTLMKDLADAFAVAYARYEDFVQLEEAKKKVEHTLNDLKSAQNQLVHSEKMASLGELTAGIAHEIQNPLNFVNNFSEVNKELMEELIEELLKGDYEEAKALAQDIMDNDAKIMHHGKRAEGIVKGMLQHSRTSSGEKELTDINVLADEYLRLSYHGLRAKDKSFNADFELDLDKALPKMNVIPQDIGRVLLNLINNAFHAVSSEAKAKEGSGFAPKVTVSTKNLDNQIQITITDNGSGIPDEIKDKIFQPFFTTKPTGEGTGLGLSLSYDIVTKGHAGKLKLDVSESTGTSFSIILPIHANS